MDPDTWPVPHSINAFARNRCQIALQARLDNDIAFDFDIFGRPNRELFLVPKAQWLFEIQISNHIILL